MRIILFLTVLAITFSSCNDTTGSKGRFDSISETDTTCLKAVKKARADMQADKLTYCHSAGSLLYEPLRSGNEMELLLHQFGISYQEEITSDVITTGQTQGCYCDFMKEYIDSRFGPSFIDSLLNISDSL